jgi:DNA helicase-2/ATP-dependent DNA helicase PcrA
MTLHKSKGKEFDGVIIFDESRISPLLYGDKEPPYYKSRKLFRVGITRAKTHVLLLTDRFTPTPLLAGFRL